ncbi:AzlD domain-containing protein [Helicobacter sp. 11S03491-1]|uniref:branched-chain amino acid transporter permease n=1 Tax=Helicobacter sp. 11S03491-1 TaxID=1476196 RepID=UPI000BA6109F|nr:AzlD domain-containing protein [Helicobacter sp. 11S03491-1]PAF41230.1 hypothetical protein BKH45_07660 [Helicobacter sp. 11S03491-1]
MMAGSIEIILVIIVVTFLMRALPFMIFNSKRCVPHFLLYLGKVLPPAIIGMLVVYCFKQTDISQIPYGLNEVVAFLCVVVLQSLLKISILSILSGTILYMYLVQSHILDKILF